MANKKQKPKGKDEEKEVTTTRGTGGHPNPPKEEK